MDQKFKSPVMKKNLHLTATIDQPELLETMVEKLATRHNETGYGKAQVPNTWQALETSSIEAFVSGMVEFDYTDDQRIRIPFITCMLFSCTKEKDDLYSLSWTSSFN